MKLTLWQQFSSNHSADFHIVGQFTTPEQAKAASEQVERWMKKIVDYHESLSDAEREIQNHEQNLTPPELELQQQYQLEWRLGSHNLPLSLDWLFHPECLVDVVRIWRNFVFIENASSSTYSGAKPFDGLLQKLGGKIAQWGEILPNSVQWDVSFDVSSDESADWFKKVFDDWFAWVNQRERKPEPDFPLWGITEFHYDRAEQHFELTDIDAAPFDYDGIPPFIDFLQTHGAQNIRVDVREEK